MVNRARRRASEARKPKGRVVVLRNPRLTQHRDARRQRPEGWRPSARPAASRTLSYEQHGPAVPSLRMHRGWSPTIDHMIASRTL